MPGSRKLGKKSDSRKAMLRCMVTYLLENGRIETTVTRAKEVRAMTEKYITLGRNNTLAAKRQAMAFITKETVVKKLFDEIGPNYANRNGGYTRITKIGPRRGDAAEMAVIELI
ncbi:MAG: 50S ribosomal protein L17 [Clostridia bacterium]|nr:50S ribosomal protein L17 [Clostridia bacterium]